MPSMSQRSALTISSSGTRSVLPGSLADDVSRFLPAAIGTVMLSARHHDTNAFGPWPSFALLAGYAAAALVAGGVLVTRCDA
jgi:hypothetical protein